jgi:hypothetical protein
VQSRATLAERRKIGAYYTPQTVTDALSEWAIRSAKDVVLEPGFGGCGFLESSATRLRALGCAEPSAQIHGCDIDDHAFHVLYARLSAFDDLADHRCGDLIGDLDIRDFALRGEVGEQLRDDRRIGDLVAAATSPLPAVPRFATVPVW